MGGPQHAPKFRGSRTWTYLHLDILAAAINLVLIPVSSSNNSAALAFAR